MPTAALGPLRVSIVVLCLTAQPMLARAGDPANPCDSAALQAASEHGVPPQVMLAITRVETGRQQDGQLQPWPWAINQGGEGHWFATEDEAIGFVESEMQAGATNIDIGCFQLNLRWHGKGFSDLTEMFDPRANARYAATFLTALKADKGNWVDAVAAYHSTTPDLAAPYVQKVESVLADMAGSAADLPTEVAAEPPRPNRFPLLQPGRRGAMASLVPAAAGNGPLLFAAP